MKTKSNPPPKDDGFDERDLEPDFSGECGVCGSVPILPLTGMCGPCTFGEADTAGGDW